MRAALRLALAGGIALTAIGLGAGCVEHPHGYTEVDVVDAQGYHHHGHYDDQHVWHGGWEDEHNVHHDDPPDWHH